VRVMKELCDWNSPLFSLSIGYIWVKDGDSSHLTLLIPKVSHSFTFKVSKMSPWFTLPSGLSPRRKEERAKRVYFFYLFFKENSLYGKKIDG
jgi:hypothetical protein